MESKSSRKIQSRAKLVPENHRAEPVKTLIKNGVVDTQKVYYILNNPEEPKCKLTISTLLKQYHKQQRKALAASRSSNFDDSVVKNLDLLIEGDVELHQLPEEFRKNLFDEAFISDKSEDDQIPNDCEPVIDPSSHPTSTRSLKEVNEIVGEQI